MKKTVLSAVLGTVLLASGFSANACTTLIVGSGATTDGSTIVARNTDDSPLHVERHFYFKADQMANVVLKDAETAGNHFSYKLPAHTLAYSTMYDYPSNSMGEVGFNSAGVGISATESIQASDAALKADPYNTTSGIGEEGITDIILSQAKTARQGVEILGHIIDTVGAGEGFGVAIVDQHEVWYLESGSGHEWAAIRIPKDTYLASANQTRIHHVNLKDTKNFLGSKTLLSYAKKEGLWNGKAPFDFAEAYSSNNHSDAYYNYPRVMELQHLLNPHTDPVFGLSAKTLMTPEKKVSVREVMHLMKNHYQDTHVDPYAHETGSEGPRPISVFRAQSGHILWVRPNMPKAIGEVEYLALGMTDLSIYVPFYQGTTQYPASYSDALSSRVNKSAYWTFRTLQTLVMTDYNTYAPKVIASYNKLEDKIMVQQQNMEKQYLSIYKKDPAAASQLIQKFEAKVTHEALAKAHQLTNQVIYQMTDNINTKYMFEGA